MRFVCAILVLFLGGRVFAQETIPPAPTAYFNDYANVVSADTAGQLNATLENFERQTSEQIVVAVFPRMLSDSSVEDYTVRVARAWQVGRKDKNNGAILFVFVQDHRLYIQVGYGLEGVLPDALCKRIIDEQIVPHFKQGDYSTGLVAGVQAILQATQGEYKGTGRTVGDDHENGSSSWISYLFIALILVVFLFGRSTSFLPWLIISSAGSGNYGRGGGFSGGGGGGFSGGGGSFGGGGAGGSW